MKKAAHTSHLVSLKETEQRHIKNVLSRVNTYISKAARILKIFRNTLGDKLTT